MNTFQGPLVAFRCVVEEDRIRQIVRRAEFRRRYDEAVARHTTQFEEGCGYKLGPMMNDQQVRRAVASWMGVAVEQQVLDLCLPLFDIMQRIEWSLQRVVTFSSPSGCGRDRYAPKPRGTMPHQIRIGGSRE
jgi:hypothetical protein